MEKRTIHIRRFDPQDYTSLVRIWNSVDPDYPISKEEARYDDEHQDPKMKWDRFVAEKDGNIVGVSQYYQLSVYYHPRKFSLDISVLPSFQGNGIGGALYEKTLEELGKFSPLSLRSRVREDKERGINFLKKRGFKEDFQEWESHLEVDKFDFSPYKGLKEKLERDGFFIRTYQELEDDPSRDQKTMELNYQINLDVPFPEPATPFTLEVFRSRMKSPDFLPEGNFIMTFGQEYVGYTNLWRSEKEDELYIGLTGVKREYRHKGIATALKVAAISYARARKVKLIRTWNASFNQAMLSLNFKLGFQRKIGFISFLKVFKEE